MPLCSITTNGINDRDKTIDTRAYVLAQEPSRLPSKTVLSRNSPTCRALSLDCAINAVAYGAFIGHFDSLSNNSQVAIHITPNFLTTCRMPVLFDNLSASALALALLDSSAEACSHLIPVIRHTPILNCHYNRTLSRSQVFICNCLYSIVILTR